MNIYYKIVLIIMLISSYHASSFANGVTVTLINEFTSGSYTACFDAKGEVFGIHCAKPGQTISHHYRWSSKYIELQVRSGHLTKDPEKSFLTEKCMTYFPRNISYIDAWPKYSNYYATNKTQVTIRIWPGPYVVRHYEGYRYLAATWNCSWNGIVEDGTTKDE